MACPFSGLRNHALRKPQSQASSQRVRVWKRCGAASRVWRGRSPRPTAGCSSATFPPTHYKLEPNGTIAVWRENTNGANGLFLARDGRLLAAEGAGRRIVAATPDKRAMPLATAFNGQPLRGPNDVIADSRGGIYFTDPAPRPAPMSRRKNPATCIT